MDSAARQHLEQDSPIVIEVGHRQHPYLCAGSLTRLRQRHDAAFDPRISLSTGVSDAEGVWGERTGRAHSFGQLRAAYGFRTPAALPAGQARGRLQQAEVAAGPATLMALPRAGLKVCELSGYKANIAPSALLQILGSQGRKPRICISRPARLHNESEACRNSPARRELRDASIFIRVKAACMPHVIDKQSEINYAFAGCIEH